MCVTHVDGLLALLSALTEGVDDLADGLEEVCAREGPQLIPLRPLCDREREGGGADGRQTQVPGHVRKQRRRGTQRLLKGGGAEGGISKHVNFNLRLFYCYFV